MDEIKKKLNDLFSSDEEKVMNALEDLEISEDTRIVNSVIYLLLNTESDKIRDRCAIVLYDMNDSRALLPLMDVIRRKEMKGKRSTLIWACSKFDCTPYLVFFIELGILESFETLCMGIMPVLESMQGYFHIKDLEKALIKLLLSKRKGKITNDKEELIGNIEKYLINLIESPKRIDKIKKFMQSVL